LGRHLPKIIIAMSYIELETFGGAEYTIVVSDENGQNKVFDDRDLAEAEAADCKDGIVVEI